MRQEIKMVEAAKNILYGGYEGSDTEICENCESLGELLIKRFRTAGEDIILVRHKIRKNAYSLLMSFCVVDRWMESLVSKLVAMHSFQNPFIWRSTLKIRLESVWAM